MQKTLRQMSVGEKFWGNHFRHQFQVGAQLPDCALVRTAKGGEPCRWCANLTQRFETSKAEPSK